jgi:formate hydrogenlyase subunit 4
LLVRLILPVTLGSPAVDIALLSAGLLAVSILVGAVESTMARLRLTKVPVLLFAACLLSAFALLLLMR